ncbi:ATP-binding protein [Sulfitobacter sp. HNIBRBA3233]|uniref:ATP-binding protein n=1 Tax=Sulfitobacter marinivivus TaxID=3158558 RepID=UPI0032DFC44C
MKEIEAPNASIIDIGFNATVRRLGLSAWSNFFLILGAFAIVVTVFVSVKLAQASNADYSSKERRDVEKALMVASNQIRLSFFDAKMVAGKVEAILTANGGETSHLIENEIESFIARNQSILAVGLAPDLVLTQSFPNRDSKAIGTRYWEVPEQMSSVALAYRQARPVVVGPVNLVQGGEGYILRYPVFLENLSSKFRKFWGIISVVIDADRMILDQATDLDLGGLIFSLSNQREQAENATEDANDLIGENNPALISFPMLGVDWFLSAIPREGWTATSPWTPLILAVSFTISILLAVASTTLHRISRDRESAHRLLLESVSCLNEGFIAFDKDGKLVTVNRRFRDYYPLLSEMMTEGASFEVMMRAAVSRGQFPEAIGREEEWLNERVCRFNNPSGPFVEWTNEGRWLKVTEARTTNGFRVGIVTDVSMEKQAVDAAVAADLEKTRFISNVSHELRTPLTVILGHASFLVNQDRIPIVQKLNGLVSSSTEISDEVTETLDSYKGFVRSQGAKIDTSAAHMLKLVEDLLDWTTCERGTTQVNINEIRIDELLDEVGEELRPMIIKKNLYFKYTGCRPMVVLADNVRLKQVFYNLISNAIKFTEKGGIDMRVVDDGEILSIHIQDTGCGIPTEYLGRIFDRFQQVDDSLARKNGGFGLGLSIAKHLIELHGGQLTVKSEFGSGSCFSVQIPHVEGKSMLKKSA